MGGGGGPSNSTSTVYQRNIPPELVPYYQMVFNGMAGQVFSTDKSPNPMEGYKMDISQPTLGHSSTDTPPPVLTQKPTPAIVPGQGGYASGGITSLARGGEVKHFSAGDVVSSSTINDAINQILHPGTKTDAQATTGLKQTTPYGSTTDSAGNLKTDWSAWQAPQTDMQKMASTTATNQVLPGQLTNATDQAIAANKGYDQTATDLTAIGTSARSTGQAAANLGVEVGRAANTSAVNLGNSAAVFGGAGSGAGIEGRDIGVSGGLKYGEQGAGYGNSAVDLANTATMAGSMAESYGALGATNASNQASLTAGDAGKLATTLGNTGSNYQTSATDSKNVNNYMNPYLQNSLNAQTAIMDQGNDITKAKNDSAAAQAGAYGGSRSLVQNTLSDEANTLAKNQLVANGYNQAYNSAQQNIAQGAQLGLAGNQAANSALGTQLQAGQLDLAGNAQGVNAEQAALQGVNAGNQSYQTGIQGAGIGLQGVGTQLTGTAQAMQGAGIGLQGVASGINAGQLGLQGAGIGLQGLAAKQSGINQQLGVIQGQQQGYAGQLASANTLGQLGQSTLADQQSIMGNQMQYGAAQQQMNQQDINNRMGVWNQQQTQPMNNLITMGNLANGVNTSSSTMYTPPPSNYSSLTGALTTAAGLYGAATKTGKKGGLLKSKNGGKGVGDLAVYGAAKYRADKGGKGSGKGIGDLAVYNTLKGGR